MADQVMSMFKSVYRMGQDWWSPIEDENYSDFPAKFSCDNDFKKKTLLLFVSFSL